jgi:putative chitinase
MITLQTLIACGVRPTQARLFAEPLASAAERFEILTCAQAAGFLAQSLHESAMLTDLEENLRYSNPQRICEIFRTGFDLNRDRRVSAEEVAFARGYVNEPVKLANRAYANRNGNGDEATGDGWRYRGSGPFQLTGRSNFAALSEATGTDYVAHPEFVRDQPVHGAIAAAWFWSSTGCNDMMAGVPDFDATTKRVNGPAMLGAHERRELFATCSKALGC